MGQEMIDEVVPYYKSFNKYKDTNDIDIIHHLLPCYENNQYQILKDKDKIIGLLIGHILIIMYKINSWKQLSLTDLNGIAVKIYG